ncbi:hypothetical protein KC19_11G168700 [Ceratodon purpureus]|uniref:Uncharacterized protein n=1 Tax=Ceratodon purpureus TaxID=3225 RepID=A0A8T0GJR1_CERPU|nr:hypothetical protein KC19_11G168700 [Ceratodon purpureus]
MWAFLGLGPAPASQFTANGRSAAWLISGSAAQRLSGSAAQRLSLDSMLTIPRIPRIPLPIVVMIYAWIMLCKWIPTDRRVRRELPIDFVPTPFRWIPNRIQFVRGGAAGAAASCIYACVYSTQYCRDVHRSLGYGFRLTTSLIDRHGHSLWSCSIQAAEQSRAEQSRAEQSRASADISSECSAVQCSA